MPIILARLNFMILGPKSSFKSKIFCVYGIDVVHGHNNVYGATVFPHNVGLGAIRQVEYQLHFFFTTFPCN